MKSKNLISLSELCAHHNIEISFIHSLQATGLIHIVVIKEVYFITPEQLHLLEQYIYFHFSLDINLEGIETISHLLNSIKSLHHETERLKNRLQFYEPHL